jgi:hypothetical protein
MRNNLLYPMYTKWRDSILSAYDGPIPEGLRLLVNSFEQWKKVYAKDYINI